MGYRPRGYEYTTAHESAVAYVIDCLRPSNTEGIYWTISYARIDPQRGLWEMSTPTIYKLIGIIQSLAFSHKNTEWRNREHGRDRFIPDICSGNYRTQRQRKAVVDSVYHFLYLLKGCQKVDAGTLHSILAGLPCNKKTFVNCSTPARKKQVEALLKFVIRSIEHPYREGRDYFPRAISFSLEGNIIINSESLIELLTRRHEDADRIIELFVDEGVDLGIIEERLDTHAAMGIGVL